MTAAPLPQMARLVEVMDTLRSPGGCPWDAEQTHASLAPYAVEETFELVEAIESGDRGHLREELGDVLLQVVFHARLAQEDPADPFDLEDVARGLTAKLIARHPHVFEGLHLPDMAALAANWERIKQQEKQRDRLLDGVPVAQPGLSRAAKVYARAQRSGLGDVVVQAADRAQADPDPGRQLGGRLLALAVEAERAGLDPEQALRDVLRRAADAVEEEHARQAG